MHETGQQQRRCLSLIGVRRVRFDGRILWEWILYLVVLELDLTEMLQHSQRPETTPSLGL